MTAVSKNVYTDRLDELVDKYNKTCHRKLKMKPADVQSVTHIDYGIKNNDKDLKFKVDNYVTISKFKNISAKGNAPNWSEEVFVIKKVKNTLL